jgi:hypothetical protein
MMQFAMMDSLRRFALLSVVGLLLSGCASTTLQSAWFDSSYQGGPLKRILVVGVTGSSVATETPGYAKLIIAQLSARGLLLAK